MVVGVLAIQGDFAAHAHALKSAGADAVEVRRANQLAAIDGLVIPGGESTTMIKFIEEENLREPIIAFATAGYPVFGTCAGAILLARTVYNPPQASLGLIDIAVERNAYGRQVDSFIAEADVIFDAGPLESVFIRAPRIKQIGPGIEVLATLNNEPVLVRGGDVMVATFHPELTRDRRVHRLFLEMVEASTGARASRR
ncbi:MAG TPA: pyridoxal 5'-phosphate synthase glutaminase subunit PdxT [Blastocatellia bacterium]|nr:pyridoxal 5'-phosphate synthase glutaminase subunit PdxT [Blastocatellia bacterium]